MYDLKLTRGEFYIMYLRKSRQDNEFESVEEVLARHERQLQQFAIRIIGEQIPEDRIFREIVSGETIEDRPEIKKVLKTIQNPKCKGVIVIEPQRLTRGDLIDLGNVLYAFQYSQTLVLTPTKIFNLENKYDRDYLERELLQGKDYVNYTKEILARGRSASAREGNYVASTAPYGYDRVKIGKYWTLVPNEVEAPFVKLAYDMYVNKGMGATSIARKLNELGAKPKVMKHFTTEAVTRMLTLEVYYGKIRWNANPQVKAFEDGKIVKKRVRNSDYELIDGKHEALISEEMFMKAKAIRGTKTRERDDLELRNIYAGLVKCKKCGSAYQQRIYKKNGVKVRADRWLCRNAYCDNMGANAEVVKSVILRTLKEYLHDFQIKIEDSNEHDIEIYESMIETIERKLEAIEVRQEELYDLLEDKTYSKEVFLNRNEKLAKEREELQERLKKTLANKPTLQDTEMKYYSLMEAIQMIENPVISTTQKNMFLKNIIEAIYFEKNIPADSTGETVDNATFELEIVLK